MLKMLFLALMDSKYSAHTALLFMFQAFNSANSPAYFNLLCLTEIKLYIKCFQELIILLLIVFLSASFLNYFTKIFTYHRKMLKYIQTS